MKEEAMDLEKGKGGVRIMHRFLKPEWGESTGILRGHERKEGSRHKEPKKQQETLQGQGEMWS